MTGSESANGGGRPSGVTTGETAIKPGPQPHTRGAPIRGGGTYECHGHL
jgi:hypothetical protein